MRLKEKEISADTWYINGTAQPLPSARQQEEDRQREIEESLCDFEAIHPAVAEVDGRRCLERRPLGRPGWKSISLFDQELSKSSSHGMLGLEG
jgi:hypothetical protein